MKIKTADLIGPALDWAVAKCEGYECQFEDEVSGPWLVPQEGFLHDEKPLSRYSPSTKWAQGGPLIAKEGTYLRSNDTATEWAAGALRKNRLDKKPGPLFYAKTPLVAAMRCFVSSKLGDEVDVPEELLS